MTASWVTYFRIGFHILWQPTNDGWVPSVMFVGVTLGMLTEISSHKLIIACSYQVGLCRLSVPGLQLSGIGNI